MNPAPSPQQLHALHAAYCAASGLTVSLRDYSRQMAWTQIAALEIGVTPEDVTAVVQAVRRKIARGELPPESLHFRNCIAKTSTFEERLIALRQHRLRRAGDAARAARTAPVPQSRALPGGGTLSVLHPAGERARDEIERIRRDATSGLRALREQLDGLGPEEVARLKAANPALPPLLPP